jgi:hypothetical protein
MYIPFPELNKKARIWIYQSDRKFTTPEQEQILAEGKIFSEQWTAHNQALKASIAVKHHQFIILSVDETQTAASGCSIDKSVHFMQYLENKLGVNLLDKSNIAFLKDEKVQLESMKTLKSKIEEGVIDENSLVFNNLVENVDAFNQGWLVEAKDSWIKRYFN